MVGKKSGLCYGTNFVCSLSCMLTEMNHCVGDRGGSGYETWPVTQVNIQKLNTFHMYQNDS